MIEQNLPDQFLENMKRLLGAEFDAFLASYSDGRQNALRLNRLKISPEQFEAKWPYYARRVPWTDNGYYVDYRDMPGRHPWYRAGVYYLQEPSAMAPAQLLAALPGDRVLDLCAAPGGKATELGTCLDGEGILVANEISASRARALERNIELFGIRNCVVTNEPPARLTLRFAAYFDKVLVDAPCSGEGMFRKDPEAAKAWHPEKVDACARTQREIILQAADMLRPGGCMVYSTCTFEPLENELAAAFLLRERPDMELLEIPCTDGRQSFSKAYSLEALQKLGYGEADSANIDMTRAVRIWPHRAGGEGHFAALFRKRHANASEPETAGSDEAGSTGAIGRGASSECQRGEALSRRRRIAASSLGALSGGQKKPGPGMTKQERERISEFMASYAPELHIDIDRCEIRDGRVYLMPAACPDVKGLRFLRAGLYIGDLKKNRFEPSQELAMAIAPIDRIPLIPEDTLRDDGVHICMPSSDARLAAFLRGEAIRPEAAGKNGWRLVCADRWPVGWGKLAGGVLKNHIPAGWRTSLCNRVSLCAIGEKDKQDKQ